MIKLQKLLITLGISLLSFNAFSQFKVVVYQPYWATTAYLQYSKVTHINYAFALPQSDGHLKPLNNPSVLQQIVSNAHANGVKVLIAIGGWSDNGVLLDPTFETLASTSTGRNNLVNDAIALVNTYNLDGVDMDWEFPDAGSSATNFDLLMSQLATELHNRGKVISAAVTASAYNGGGIPANVFSYIDHLNVMAYDNDQEAHHSTYNYAQSSINYWVGTRGCPKSKVILGVPFYARPSWNSYSTLLGQGASPTADQFGSDYYNGIPTIQSKTELAWNTAGGIMVWEMSQDVSGSNSLLSAIHTKKVALAGTSGNPTVNLTSPASSTSYTAPASVVITASASDANGISKVDFYHGTTLLNSDAASPYTYTWSNVAAGSYTITAKAYDALNNVSTSSAVAITVKAPNQVPAVAITSPANGTAYASSPRITIAASASDADGTVSKVEFYRGSTLLYSDASAPYSYIWSKMANGTYALTAKAYDNSGAITTSNAVTVNIGSSSPNVAPSVSLTSPTAGATFTAPASVTISANAADTDGTISKVEFYNGTTLLNSDVASPYTYTWASVAAGSYSITAKAYDNSGAITTSSAVSITVNSVANVAPSVSLTSPTAGATFTAPASVTISANAADTDGTISKVEFYNGTTLLNSDVASPYTYTWASAAAGSYSITAKAYDNSGAITTSSAVSITVNTGGGSCTAPLWNVLTPYNGGDNIQYNGIRYQANWWTQGNQPDLNSGPVGSGQPWTSLGSCNSRVAQVAPAEFDDLDNVQVSPNPCHGSFALSNINFKGVSITMTNSHGVEVLNTKGHHGHVEKIHLSHISAGVYFVTIHAGGKSVVRKLIVQ